MPGDTVYASVGYDTEAGSPSFFLINPATFDVVAFGTRVEGGKVIEFTLGIDDPTRLALWFQTGDSEPLLCLPYEIQLYVESHPCNADPCGENQVCSFDPASEGHYTCDCATDYVWNKQETECVEHPCITYDVSCQDHATCMVNWETEFGYECVCDENFLLETGGDAGDECVFYCEDDTSEDNDVSGAAAVLTLDQVVGPTANSERLSPVFRLPKTLPSRTTTGIVSTWPPVKPWRLVPTSVTLWAISTSNCGITKPRTEYISEHWRLRLLAVTTRNYSTSPKKVERIISKLNRMAPICAIIRAVRHQTDQSLR